MSKLRKKVLALYKGQGLKTWLYTHIRYRLCPFARIAEHVPEDASILDLGCGVGMLSNYLNLRSSKSKVLGVDLNENRIDCAVRTVKRREHIEFQLKNALELNEDFFFDAVTMTDFLHHLSEEGQRELLEFLHGRLPVQGRLVIQDVIEKPRWKLFVADRLDRMLNKGVVSNYRTEQGWKDFLGSLGFQVEVYPAGQGLPLPDAIFVGIKQ